MKKAFIAAMLLLAAGCAAREALVPPTDARLQQGYSLYINKCGGCHELYAPSTQTAAEWKVILEKMEKRVKLREDEQQQMLEYLRSESAAERMP